MIFAPIACCYLVAGTGFAWATSLLKMTPCLLLFCDPGHGAMVLWLSVNRSESINKTVEDDP